MEQKQQSNDDRTVMARSVVNSVDESALPAQGDNVLPVGTILGEFEGHL